MTVRSISSGSRHSRLQVRLWNPATMRGSIPEGSAADAGPDSQGHLATVKRRPLQVSGRTNDDVGSFGRWTGGASYVFGGGGGWRRLWKTAVTRRQMSSRKTIHHSHMVSMGANHSLDATGQGLARLVNPAIPELGLTVMPKRSQRAASQIPVNETWTDRTKV